MNPAELGRAVAALSDDDRALLLFITRNREQTNGLVFASEIRAHFAAEGWTAERLARALRNLSALGMIETQKPGAA